MYHKRYNFCIGQKQSDYIDDRVHAEKKLPEEERRFHDRSQFIRKLIHRDMKLLNSADYP